MRQKEIERSREARHRRVRKKVIGTSLRPRLSVHKSHKNIMVHLIDDAEGKILLTLSTQSKSIRNELPSKYGGNCQAACYLGESVARDVQKMRIKEVVFDRGGYPFHGRIKALAEGARKGGLHF